VLQELAEAYELYPEVAAINAAYWKAVAPPASAVFESARYQEQQQAAALKKVTWTLTLDEMFWSQTCHPASMQ
jgi:hypothetical protein